MNFLTDDGFLAFGQRYTEKGDELFFMDDERFNYFDDLVLDVNSDYVLRDPVGTIDNIMYEFAKKTEKEKNDYRGWTTKLTTSSLQYAFTNPFTETDEEREKLVNIKKFITRAIIIYEQTWLRSEDINKDNWKEKFDEELKKVHAILDERNKNKGRPNMRLRERLFFEEPKDDKQLFFTETSINYQRASFEFIMATLFIGIGGKYTDRKFLNQFYHLLVFLDKIKGKNPISPFFFHFFHFFRISYLRRTQFNEYHGDTDPKRVILLNDAVEEVSLHLGYRKEYGYWRNAEYNGDKRISNAMSSLCSLLSIYPRITEYTKPGQFKTYYINGRFSAMTSLEHIAYDNLPGVIEGVSPDTTIYTLSSMVYTDIFLRNNIDLNALLSKHPEIKAIKGFHGYNHTPTEEEATVAHVVQLLEHQKEILNKYKGKTVDAEFKQANDDWLNMRKANKVKMLCLNKDGKLLYKEIGTIGDILEAINKSDILKE